MSRDQAYFDIFVTAMEGGIGYWSTCGDYRWRKPETNEENLEGFWSTIYETEDPETCITIDRSVIATGVSRFVKDAVSQPYFQQAAHDLRYGKWDDLDVDATIADVIVQLSLFGEVRYG